MSGYPSADDYAFSLEPKRLAKYMRGNQPLLASLSSGEVKKNRGSRYLHVANGYYAYIYKVKVDPSDAASAPPTYFALRWLRIHPPKDSAARYQSIGQFVSNRMPPYLVSCNHFEDALFVSVGSRGAWYPVQVMEWIEGKTLLEAVAELVRKKDTAGLFNLASQWRELILMMKRDGVVHGDLHPDNVIVQDKGQSLRLVDYDTLVVPGFAVADHEGGGMTTYIHPCFSRGLQPRQYSPEMDDFGALNILLSLLALSHNPKLRATTEYLLIGAEDVEQPGNSALLEALCRHQDPLISRLATSFRQECLAPRETGQFHVETVLQGVPSPVPTLAATTAVPTAPSVSNGRRTLDHAWVEIPSSVGMSAGVQTLPPVELEIPSSVSPQGPITLPYEPVDGIPSSLTKK